MIKKRFLKVAIKHDCQFCHKDFSKNNNDDLKLMINKNSAKLPNNEKNISVLITLLCIKKLKLYR